jgi:hypothetical protein
MSNLIPPLLSSSPPPIVGPLDEDDDDEFGDFRAAAESYDCDGEFYLTIELVLSSLICRFFITIFPTKITRKRTEN